MNSAAAAIAQDFLEQDFPIFGYSHSFERSSQKYHWAEIVHFDSAHVLTAVKTVAYVKLADAVAVGFVGVANAVVVVTDFADKSVVANLDLDESNYSGVDVAAAKADAVYASFVAAPAGSDEAAADVYPAVGVTVNDAVVVTGKIVASVDYAEFPAVETSAVDFGIEVTTALVTVGEIFAIDFAFVVSAAVAVSAVAAVSEVAVVSAVAGVELAVLGASAASNVLALAVLHIYRDLIASLQNLEMATYGQA